MKDLENTLNALLSEALEEDALENEPAVEKAEEAGHEDGRVEATPVDDVKPVTDSADNVVSAELEKKEEDISDDSAALPSVEDSKKEIADALVGNTVPAVETSVDESFERINALLDQINEELDLPDGKIENKEITDDTADRSDVYPKDEDLEEKDIDDVDVDNEDIYDDEMEKKSDDVEGIVQENQILFKILEDAGILSVEKSENLADVVDDDHYDENNELVDDSELERKDVYPEDEDLEKKDVEEVNIDNEDIYNSETEVADEEVDSEVVNEALAMLSEMSYDEVCVFLESNGIEASDENIAILERFLNENEWRDAEVNAIKAGRDAKLKVETDPNRRDRIARDATDRAAAAGNGAAKRQVRRREYINPDPKKREAVANARRGHYDSLEVGTTIDGDRKYVRHPNGQVDEYKLRRKRLLIPGMAFLGGRKYRKNHRPVKKADDVSASYNMSIEDMVYILESNGYESSLENLNILSEALEAGYYSLVLTEEDEVKIVPSNPEDEQYDVDEEISDDCCDEKDDDKVTPEDLHEEDDVKPEDLVSHEKEETPEGGIVDQNLDIAGDSADEKDDPTTELPMDNEPEDAEVKPEDIVVKESVQYTSIKEACMLDEGYFHEDTFVRETAEMKQDRLVEQVSLIMARESADPLYEELLKSAAYLSRLQEACKKKYKARAMTKAKKIIGEPKAELNEDFLINETELTEEDCRNLNDFLNLVQSDNLDEGVINAVRGKLVSMAITILPKSQIDKVINKAFTKAMQKATDPESKKKLMDLRKELLSMEPKAKKLKLKTLIKKAPEKDIAAAEMKLKAELKKAGKIQESVMFEDSVDDVMAGGNAARDEYIAGQTVSAADAIGRQTVADETIKDLNNQAGNLRMWAIIATIVAAILAAALIAIIVHNIKMGMDY